MSKYERESIRRAGQVPQWVLMRPRRQGRWGESSPDTAALGWLPGGKEPPRVLNYGLGRGVEGSSMQTARRRCAIPFKNLVLRPERWGGEAKGCFLGGGGRELGRQEGGPWGERQKCCFSLLLDN